MTLEIKETSLPAGLIARPVTFDDVAAGVALINAQLIEEGGSATETVEGLLAEWQSPGFDVAKSTMAVFTPAGQMVGYSEIWDIRDVPVRPHMWGYVHPDYRNQGIGTWLTHWVERRAHDVIDRVPADARIVMESSNFSLNEGGKQLLNELGMTYAGRSWWYMVIEMETEPPKPVLPAGITFTTQAELNDLRTLHRVAKESFKDHRGYVQEDFETSFARLKEALQTDNVPFDPSLYIAAMDGDKVIGVSLCRAQHWTAPDEGYIGTLGVLRDYRQRGLATALLQQSFNVFWQRGQRKVSLHVDGSSITGATRIYERAGMRIKKSFDAYEKELRPGREITNQG